jgi:putative phosphoserine phosphatase / 1-acylglycerol-3-phosphate O-acyltransferase
MENISLKDNNTPKDYIVFFDLDQTITRSVSGKEVAKAAYRKGLLKHRNLAKAVVLLIASRLKLRDPLKMIDDMVSWVKDMPEEMIADLCSDVSREVLIPSVFKEAIAEIEYHKSKNAKVVILSSALTYICREMAVYLNIDDIICSELEVKDGLLTGRPLGSLCFGNNKAIGLKEYCETNNVSSIDAWYYGDSISDLPALSVVGHQVCVNPDNKLKIEATNRGWKILLWKA